MISAAMSGRLLLGLSYSLLARPRSRPQSHYQFFSATTMASAPSVESYDESCIFCRISRGSNPSFKLVESDLSYSFLDISPLAKGHALVIPKYHAVKMHELPDESLTDLLTIAKRIALAQGLVNYNILQNNGRIAHQEVNHVHFHVIPKPSESDEEGPGLVIDWLAQSADMVKLKALQDAIVSRL